MNATQAATEREFVSAYFSPSSEVEISSLPIGETAQVPVLLETNQLDPGSYTLRVEVDPASGTAPSGRVIERNELNNQMLLQMMVLGADLWVERFDAVAGNPGRSHLWGTITNLGAVASGPFNVAFYYVPVPGGELVQVATRAIENLEPGETRTTLRTIETADWEPGYYDVRIVVDPDNEILELNEENNAKDEELRVR